MCVSGTIPARRLLPLANYGFCLRRRLLNVGGAAHVPILRAPGPRACSNIGTGGWIGRGIRECPLRHLGSDFLVFGIELDRCTPVSAINGHDVLEIVDAVPFVSRIPGPGGVALSLRGVDVNAGKLLDARELARRKVVFYRIERFFNDFWWATSRSYYPSIAAVCRRLQINRQQFNK